MGTLNFLNRAMIPGRAFTRRMYAKLTDIRDGRKIVFKPHHHITLNSKFLQDCKMWEFFLTNSDKTSLCRPFIDVYGIGTAQKLQFYSDASASVKRGGFGAYYSGRWIAGMWEKSFLIKCNPSIEFLELYALCLGIFTWQEELQNTRVVLYCDNRSVCDMVNHSSSKCPKCMILIRLLTLNCLTFNQKIYIDHIGTKSNTLADSLSRQNFVIFWKNAPKHTLKYPDQLPSEIWPVAKIWDWNRER